MEPSAPSHQISLTHSKQRKNVYYNDITFKRCYAIISGQVCGWKDVQLKHQPYIQVGKKFDEINSPFWHIYMGDLDLRKAVPHLPWLHIIEEAKKVHNIFLH